MRVRLFFFWATGCPACAAAKPALRRYRDANPHVDVQPYDVTDPEFTWPENAVIQPDGFPFYVLHVPGRRVDARTGALENPAEIERWVESEARKLLPPMPANVIPIHASRHSLPPARTQPAREMTLEAQRWSA